MDHLDDHMLTQILLRLPNCATVQACSPVNKRWYSLISDPNFLAQFVDHKKKTTTLLKGSGFNHEDDEQRWTFITTRRSNEQLLITEFIFGSPKLSLEFLPNNTLFTPTATFKDLVLCVSSAAGQYGVRVYRITNLLNKQWIALPPSAYQWTPIAYTALVCHLPYNHTQNYKFRVVEVLRHVINYRLDTIELVVYCSEIGEWKEIKLGFPKEAGPLKVCLAKPEIVVCNGIIYFKIGLSLVAFDPFDVNDACDTNLKARVMPPLPGFGFLKESSGHLLVVHSLDQIDDVPYLWHRKDGTTMSVHMVMWKLGPNQASLVWETTFQGLCKGELPHYTQLSHIDTGDIHTEGIGIHPYNDKLIYMYLRYEGLFVLCDTQTCCITFLKRLPKSMGRFHRLEQQWWPTSVPAMIVAKVWVIIIGIVISNHGCQHCFIL